MFNIVRKLNYLPELKQDYRKHWYYVDSNNDKIEVNETDIYLYKKSPMIAQDGIWIFLGNSKCFRDELVQCMKDRLSGKTFDQICEYVVDNYEMRY